jgi:hypothetical protein
VLTPIPGTEQYDDFLHEGLITEDDLDRFDGTTVTWRHPNLESERLTSLLFRCHGDFFAARKVLPRLASHAAARWDFRTTAGLLAMADAGIQAWDGIRRRVHPMSGGIGRVRRDRAADYLPLRRGRFGIDSVPLPRSLALTAADEEINRRAKLPLPLR